MDDPRRELAWLFEDEDDDLPAALDEAIVRRANELLAEVERTQATALHVDAARGAWSVRLRVDGRLRRSTFDPLPAAEGQAVVQRFKLLAGWRPEPLPTPTEGHIHIRIGGTEDRRLTVRTVPARHGESLTVEVARPRPALTTLDGLQLPAGERRLVEAALTRRRGLLLVVGPRGSGRRTFIRACLGLLAADGSRCVAATDRWPGTVPPGVLALNRTCPIIGPTIPDLLRAAERAGVDALGLLEPERDDVQVVLRAAASRLVLLAVDAPDAARAVAQLREAAPLADPLAWAAALKQVVSLRLARRLCPECKAPAPAPASADVLRLAPRLIEEGGHWTCFAPRGCPACDGTGRRGRLPVIEVSPQVGESLSLEGDLREALSGRSRRTLRESALALVRDGEVALEDALAASA